MFLHEAMQILRTYLFTSLHSRELQKRTFHVLILATTPWRCSAQCIPTCSYCIYVGIAVLVAKDPYLLTSEGDSKRSLKLLVGKWVQCIFNHHGMWHSRSHFRVRLGLVLGLGLGLGLALGIW